MGEAAELVGLYLELTLFHLVPIYLNFNFYFIGKVMLRFKQVLQVALLSEN